VPSGLRTLPLALALGVLAVACTSGGGDDPGGSPAPAQLLNAAMATTDHYVGAPQRIGVGLIFGDGELLSFGAVEMRFSYVGTAQAPTDPQPGPSAIGVYLPTPGTPDDGTKPTVTQPSKARGIYQAEGVTFDRAGFWQVDLIADVEGFGSQRAATTFPVAAEPSIPAPGERAPTTENLTMRSKGVPLAAIDSRATTTGRVPDPDLHRWTIARAIAEGRPALVLFATPVYCQSRFCGPVTDDVEDLAKRFADRAVFIHVEIWQDFETQQITQAAAEWLYRKGDLTEPWLYLIGPDGTIVDRWGVLFREDEVAGALRALPRMPA
jgi:hypothetical protein